MILEDMARSLVRSAALHAPDELRIHPERVPDSPGVYAWFFDGINEDWSRECVTRDGWKLLYVGVSTGRRATQSLRGRIVQNHLRGTAEGSTLRRSLGVTLGKLGLICGICLRQINHHKTFGGAEAVLTKWIAHHGRVCWVETEDPHPLERHLLDSKTLPLNIKNNPRNEFRKTLSVWRRPCPK